ncbi:MAG: ABC transporter permease [Spirochaetales bacterium]|nr:ABC transporter permease [Spirochaetales bacterium]
MKKLLSLMKFDTVNALRDSMVIYILVAPLLIAGALRIFLPGFERAVITVAVQAASAEETAVAQEVERFARVEVYPDAEAVEERVGRTDSVGGLVRRNGEWTILLEGNEDPASEAVMQAVVQAALRGQPAAKYTVEDTGNRSRLKEYASVFLIMMASLIGGLAVAFAMIDEKEQNVTRAFSISPLTPAQYFLARGLLAFLAGVVIALIGHLIMSGFSTSLAAFFLALIASAAIPLAIALLVGGLAGNQIQAVAVLKIVMLIYMTFPLVSIFTGPSWQWPFYILPNYWMFKVFESVYVLGKGAPAEPEFWLNAGVCFVTGTAFLGILGKILKKNIQPR